MKFQFKVLQAGHGDCILIQGSFDGQPRNILIDGGPSKTFKDKNRKGPLLKELEKIQTANQKVDLLILTHVDDDHIAGLLKGFKNNGILSTLTERVWFNSGRLIDAEFNKEICQSHSIEFDSPSSTESKGFTSVRQGIAFEDHISQKKIWHESLIMAGQKHPLFGITFTIISPTRDKLEKLLVKWSKEQPSSLTGSTSGDYDTPLNELLIGDDEFNEDDSIHNGSSIAFIFEYNNKKLLFLADAHNDVILEQLKSLGHSQDTPLQVDYVKLAHHGSQYNTSMELLKLLDCNNYIISSNTHRFKLPNKRTIARIMQVKPTATIYFNYPKIIHQHIFSPKELKTIQSMEISLKPCQIPFEL